MNCQDAKALLGESLDATATAALRDHLEACPACAAEAEALRDLRAWLRADAPPFGEEDRRALRRAVMAQVRVEAPRRRRAYLLALPLAAALLLALSLRRSPPAPTAPAVPRVAQALPPVPAQAARPVPVPRPRRRPPAPEAPTVASMELHTADPTIRIIWLAQAAPAPELP